VIFVALTIGLFVVAGIAAWIIRKPAPNYEDPPAPSKPRLSEEDDSA
jgi:hypothetical protein